MKTSGGIVSKVWQAIRIAFMLIKKGISMKKILLDLSLMMKLKRGKLTGKALRNLKLHHRNNENHHGSTSNGGGATREYEFSCSNSPLYRHCFTATTTTKKNKKNRIYLPSFDSFGEIETSIEAVDRVLERITKLQDNKDDDDEDVVEFAEVEKEESGSHEHVDEAAEEFIKRFYSQLKLQPATTLLN